MIFERTVKEIRGDYAVLVGESGVETEVALALLQTACARAWCSSVKISNIVSNREEQQ